MEPILPGLVPAQAILLDERRRPDFRDVFGALARRSTDIRTAVTRVRLSTVDLSPDELENVQSMRVLMSEVSAMSMDAEAASLVRMPRRAPNLRLLMSLLEAERLEVRAAPLGGWSPDFTVFSGSEAPTHLLTGFHAFERPFPHRGPALASLHGGEAARLAAVRHDELWRRAHDIGPALWSILARADHQARRSG